MREIILKSIHLENFKIFKNATFQFSQLTKIFGQNYRGKSSIVDSFFWVLFGKSSTGNSEGKQFCPRRYDENGVLIDHVDVVVELQLEVDGKPMTIRKVQKQNWVRKRGAEVETYEGDTNEYFWNEVPVKESEHKKRVAEIIDEEVFKMITNPHAFVGKKQDEQRKFLVEKVAQISDDDVFAEIFKGAYTPADEEFRDMLKKNTIEEIKAINKKALQGYKSQQETIPVRIDETSKLIIDIDFAEQELALSALKMQLAEIERKISDTSEAYGEVTKIKSEIAEYRSKLTEIETTKKNALAVKRRDVQSKLDNVSYALVKASQSKLTTSKDIELLTEKISAWETTFETLKKRYSEEKAKEFDETQNLCPVCGKEFDEEKKAELLAKFQEDKKAKLHQINLDGKKIQDDIVTNKKRLAELEEQSSSLTAEIEKLTADETAVKEELSVIPTEIDLSDNTDYQGYKASIRALENAIAETQKSLADTDIIKADLTARKADIAKQIEEVTKELGKKQTIEDAKDRVDELREELRQATAKAAECERLEWVIEQFETKKMDLLSERINAKFSKVRWKLWNKLKNGGVEPVCVCTLNGIPYGQDTLSTTEKMIAGCDILQTLMDIYQIKVPVFFDNAEAYSEINQPKLDTQMIMLFVSDDKEMIVKNE
jgi:DNA repair exonuclease SbcCD ATPase subunit